MKIFDTLLGVLPSWLPFAALGALALGLVSGVLALKASWRAEGAAQVIAADREAVIDQQRRDAALSAAIVARQAEQLATLSARADALVKRIDNAPKTTGCGPVMRDASRGLHELFDSAGAAPAGRQPPAALPGSRARRGP